MTELRQLAGFAVNFRLEQAPEEVVRAAKYCVLDSIGSALGAVRYEEIPELCRELRQWCAAPAGRTASVWGQGFSLDVFQALLLNGMMGHALELDDVHTGSKSHVGAVVVETAWTLAEAMGESGRRLLEAVITGYEVMARVGMAMDVVSNRKRGWHGTGIIGTFGAAAAAGHLLGLDEDQMVSALGMAGTQSSGLWAFLEEGATCKKLHPARAAVNGLTAAVLAKGGMTGPERILDAGDGGLYRAVADSFNMETLVNGLGTGYEILKIDKKPYPCCRTTHRRGVNAAGKGGSGTGGAHSGGDLRSGRPAVRLPGVSVQRRGGQIQHSLYRGGRPGAGKCIPCGVCAGGHRRPADPEPARSRSGNRRSAVYRPLPGPLGLPRSPD